jgi:hypothetical protein
VSVTAFDLYDSAIARLGLNFPDGLVGEGNESGVLSTLNDALAELAVDHDWLFSYTESEFQTSPGVWSYPPPNGWLRTSWLILTSNGSELQPRQRRDHFRFGPERGEPRYFDTSGDRLLIAPVPDGVYRIRHGYFYSIERIERDSATWPDLYDQLREIDISVPDPYIPLVKLYVLKNVALLIKDREAHQMATEELRSYRNKVEDNRRRQQQVGRIVTREDY